MQSRTIVHVIDDDDALRDSLAFLMSSAGIETQTHDSAAGFLAAVQNDPSGCVVTDVRMPGMTGIELLRELKRLAPALPVIVMTGHADVPLAVEAMKLGAFDFIEKPFDDEVLLASVQNALGQHQKESKRGAERSRIHERLTSLTARERQVLDGLVLGHANKTIAFDLGISPRTVEIYRANVMTKMEAASLSDLVRMALAAGLLDSAG
jgi:two-component system response regulator FixJ